MRREQQSGRHPSIESTALRSHKAITRQLQGNYKAIRGHQRPSERRGEHTWSASLTVDRRCATTRTVRPLEAASIASCTSLSDSASSAEVASSSRRMRGSESSARAMATRCFCPPLSLTPRSPTSVAYLMRGTIRGNQSALSMHSACTQHALSMQRDAIRQHAQSSIVPVGEPLDEGVRVCLAACGLDARLHASTCPLRWHQGGNQGSNQGGNYVAIKGAIKGAIK